MSARRRAAFFSQDLTMGRARGWKAGATILALHLEYSLKYIVTHDYCPLASLKHGGKGKAGSWTRAILQGRGGGMGPRWDTHKGTEQAIR